MEIEKKFLLYERGRDFSNKQYFNSVKSIRFLVSVLGKKIIQTYLDLENLEEILRTSKVSLGFNPDEARVRKYGKDYFLTFKSRQKSFSREEFEVKISKLIYEKLLKFSMYYLEKIRFAKVIGGFKVEFDYYKKLDLFTCEVEVNGEDKLESIPKFGKLISGVKKYKNRELARYFG